MVIDKVYASVFLNKCVGSLFADSGNTGDIVR